MGFLGSGLELVALYVGVTVSYIIAAAMIGLGVYLAMFLGANPFAGPLRFVGLCLIAAGMMIAAYNLGKANGAAACEAAWKAKNYEAQIARLRQERDAKDIAAATAAQQAEQLASENNESQRKIADYKETTDNLSGALAACRRASDDDDKRLCAITGQSAAGCKSP